MESTIKMLRNLAVLAAVGIASAPLLASGIKHAPQDPDYQISITEGLVTLRVDDGSLVEVMQELARRADFEIIADPGDGARVSANFEGVGLREAIRRMCKPIGYVEVLDPDTGKVARVVLTPSKAAPVARVSERREPLSPRQTLPEQPVEPEPVEPSPEEIEAAAREEQRQKQEQQQREGQEQQPAEAVAPPEPQIFPPAFANDERSDDRRGRTDDD